MTDAESLRSLHWSTWEFALGTPVVLWVGWPILRKFWFSLIHRALNMYTLIGLGVGLAYVFSLAAACRQCSLRESEVRLIRCHRP